MGFESSDICVGYQIIFLSVAILFNFCPVNELGIKKENQISSVGGATQSARRIFSFGFCDFPIRDIPLFLEGRLFL